MPGVSSGMHLFDSVPTLISISLGCMAQFFMLTDGLLLTKKFSKSQGSVCIYITVGVQVSSLCCTNLSSKAELVLR